MQNQPNGKPARQLLSLEIVDVAARRAARLSLENRLGGKGLALQSPQNQPGEIEVPRFTKTDSAIDAIKSQANWLFGIEAQERFSSASRTSHASELADEPQSPVTVMESPRPSPKPCAPSPRSRPTVLKMLLLALMAALLAGGARQCLCLHRRLEVERREAALIREAQEAQRLASSRSVGQASGGLSTIVGIGSTALIVGLRALSVDLSITALLGRGTSPATEAAMARMAESEGGVALWMRSPVSEDAASRAPRLRRTDDLDSNPAASMA